MTSGIWWYGRPLIADQTLYANKLLKIYHSLNTYNSQGTDLYLEIEAFLKKQVQKPGLSLNANSSLNDD